MFLSAIQLCLVYLAHHGCSNEMSFYILHFTFLSFTFSLSVTICGDWEVGAWGNAQWSLSLYHNKIVMHGDAILFACTIKTNGTHYSF